MAASNAPLARRRRSGQSGQSLVELALTMPIVILLIFGVIEFSMALRSYQQLTNATREGARYGSLGSPAGSYPADCSSSPPASVIGKTCAALSGLKLANVSSVTVTYPGGNISGQSVVVTTNYVYRFFTPVGGLIRFFTGGAFSDQINFKTTTTMRLE